MSKKFSSISLPIIGALAIASPILCPAAPAHADEGKPPTPEATWSRLAGNNRVETSFLIAQRAFFPPPQGAPVVYLADADNYVDALSNCSAEDGPTLLIPSKDKARLTEFKNKLTQLGAEKAIILGGENAIPTSTLTKSLPDGISWVRWSGKDRYSTAREIAKNRYPNGSSIVYLVNGSERKTKQIAPDAVSVGSLPKGAILLTDGTQELDPATVEQLQQLNPQKIVYVGGSDAIPDSYTQTIKTVLPLTKTERINGENRYATNYAIANRAFPTGSPVLYLVRAENPVDAIPAATLKDGPIFIQAQNTSLTAWIMDYLSKYPKTQVIALGGPGNKNFPFFYKPPEPPASQYLPLKRYISQFSPVNAKTGCEATALLMGLSIKGRAMNYSLRRFLAEMPYSPNQDPEYGFVGSPYANSATLRTTIYPRPLTEFAKRFGPAANLTGASMNQIIYEIRSGNPVVIYATAYWQKPYRSRYNINGSVQYLVRNNHAVLLYGYDQPTDRLLVADPANYRHGRFLGSPYTYWIPRSTVEPIYNERYHAVAIR